jgi:hypothetical protein
MLRHTRFLALGLALTLGHQASAQTTLDISVNPTVVGPGDDGTVLIMNGTPGHFAFLLTSLEPGPITLPVVGSVDVGLGGLDYVVFGALPASGAAVFPCKLPCVVTSSVYMQALTIAGQPLALTGISPQLVLGFDPNIIDDCDMSGTDDDCDLEQGLVPDCNGNGVPDECDITSGTSRDDDGDGMPDECCPEVCRMEARYTFDGPLPSFPILLTIQVLVPGVPSAAGNQIQVTIDSPLPSSATSTNGDVTASDFQLTPTGGLTFRVVYEPQAGASGFGASLWMLAEAQDHCTKTTISGGMRSSV